MRKEMTKEQLNKMRIKYIGKLLLKPTFHIVDMWNEYAEAEHFEHIYETLPEIVDNFDSASGFATALLGGEVSLDDLFFYLADDGYIKSFTHYAERTSPIYLPAIVDWQIKTNHIDWLDFVAEFEDE